MKKGKGAFNADFNHILLLIKKARDRAYSKINEELVSLYFNVGKIVSKKVTTGKWGEGTVNALANFIQLRQPCLNGFNRRGLYRMKQFYEAYTEQEFLSMFPSKLLNIENMNDKAHSKKIKKTKVSPPATQLQRSKNQQFEMVLRLLTQISWSNHLEILSGTKSPDEKIFYLILAAKEKFNKLELRRQIQTAAFERVMLSNKTISVVHSQLPSGLFKDPYIFEFLDLPEVHSENDLERALVNNLQKFILEIGKGFAYMGRQFVLQVGAKDYRTDLLFYHRDLQCLVLFELKIEEFAPEFLGKLNFYLEALDRNVKHPHENPSIGILLCKGKDTEIVEYSMARNTAPALIAEYKTKLIDKKLLAIKLHQLVEQLTNQEIG
jgi:predicted nuclease of restriction endonuclease-like (RecB) superfamily